MANRTTSKPDESRRTLTIPLALLIQESRFMQVAQPCYQVIQRSTMSQILLCRPKAPWNCSRELHRAWSRCAGRVEKESSDLGDLHCPLCFTRLRLNGCGLVAWAMLELFQYGRECDFNQKDVHVWQRLVHGYLRPYIVKFLKACRRYRLQAACLQAY